MRSKQAARTEATSEPLADEIIRSIERCEIAAWKDMYQAAGEPIASTCGIQTSDEGGAIVTVAAKVDVLGFNRVVGLGMDEPASEEMLDRIVDRYATYRVPRFFVQLSPVAGPELLPSWLHDRGFSHYNNWVKLYRGVESPFSANTAARIERVVPEHAERFGAIVVEAFGWPAAVGPWIGQTVGRPGWRHYMAFHGDSPVAAGALFVSGQCGWLSFGSTVVGYRGRGAQSALLTRRITDAATEGCAYVVTETAEGTPERPSPSYRNVIRLGFRVAYLRPNYLRGPPGALE